MASREQRDAACTGKHAFETRDMAVRVLKRQKRRSGATLRLTVYHCPFCHAWHIGRRSDKC